MDGWILLHKKLLKWEWFQNADTLQLFLYCLLRANFEPVKWQGVDIQRGQFSRFFQQVAAFDDHKIPILLYLFK